MYVLTISWIVVVALLIYQHRNPKTKNYLPILWSSQLAMLCLGFLGTTSCFRRFTREHAR